MQTINTQKQLFCRCCGNEIKPIEYSVRKLKEKHAKGLKSDYKLLCKSCQYTNQIVISETGELMLKNIQFYKKNKLKSEAIKKEETVKGKVITGFSGCLVNGFTFDHSLSGLQNRNFLKIFNN